MLVKTEEGQKLEKLCATQTTLTKESFFWKYRRYGQEIPLKSSKKPKEGDPVFESLFPEKFNSPMVILFSLKTGLFIPSNLKTLMDYFPETKNKDVKDFNIPTPNTHEFWGTYAEPLENFLDALFDLTFAINTFSELQLSSKKEGLSFKEVKENGSLFWDCTDKINQYASGVRNAVIPLDNDKVTSRWAFPSLLNAIAFFFIETLSLENKPELCQNCGKMFLPQKKTAKYCSPTCRNTAQKRRYRAKEEKKK